MTIKQIKNNNNTHTLQALEAHAHTYMYTLLAAKLTEEKQ